jgi:hypothetical protein
MLMYTIYIFFLSFDNNNYFHPFELMNNIQSEMIQYCTSHRHEANFEELLTTNYEAFLGEHTHTQSVAHTHKEFEENGKEGSINCLNIEHSPCLDRWRGCIQSEDGFSLFLFFQFVEQQLLSESQIW